MLRESERFPCIDGLRALAAISVVLCHTAGATSIASTPEGSYLVELRSGVQVFFVISGFVLYRPFARAHLTGEIGPALVPYLRRRFLRIYPAYWMVLTICVYVLHVLYLDGLRAVVTNYALVQTYVRQDSIYDGLAPAWTLVVEMSFYLALPVIAYAIGRSGRTRPLNAEFAGLALLFCISMLCTAWTAFGTSPQFVQILPMNFSPFALGMLLAVLSVHFRDRSLPSWLAAMSSRPWASWFVAIAAWSALTWAVHYPAVLPLFGRIPGWKILAYTLLLDIIGLFMVFPAVFGDQQWGAIRQGLRLRPIVYLGAISYGIYLWHDPLISELSKWVNPRTIVAGDPIANWLAFTCLVLATTVVVATLSWYAVERPLIAVSRGSVFPHFHRRRNGVFVVNPSVAPSPTHHLSSPTVRPDPHPTVLAPTPED